MKQVVLILSLAAVVVSLNGCIAAAVGAGAAAGYKAHQEGYRLQAPVRKEEQW